MTFHSVSSFQLPKRDQKWQHFPEQFGQCIEFSLSREPTKYSESSCRHGLIVWQENFNNHIKSSTNLSKCKKTIIREPQHETLTINRFHLHLNRERRKKTIRHLDTKVKKQKDQSRILIYNLFIQKQIVVKAEARNQVQ